MEYLKSALDSASTLAETAGGQLTRSGEDGRIKKQIAAILGRMDEDGLAIDICACRPMKMGGYPCGRIWACRYCAAVAALTDRRERTARALLALEANSRLAFYFVTLTGVDSDDLEEQIADLKRWLNRSLRARRGAWSKVKGMMWWIEPQRGLSKRWRSHIHAIVAFDEGDAPGHPRRMILQWANRVRRALPEPWYEPWEKDRKYRDMIEHLRIEPLRSYATSNFPDPPSLCSRVSSTCNPLLLVFDLMDTARYCRQDERFKDPDAKKRPKSLTAEDRVLLTLLGPSLRLRQCTGVFRGMSAFDLEDLQEQLRELDTPSLRDECVTRALAHPSEARSLVPRPRSYDVSRDTPLPTKP